MVPVAANSRSIWARRRAASRCAMRRARSAGKPARASCASRLGPGCGVRRCEARRGVGRGCAEPCAGSEDSSAARRIFCYLEDASAVAADSSAASSMASCDSLGARAPDASFISAPANTGALFLCGCEVWPRSSRRRIRIARRPITPNAHERERLKSLRHLTCRKPQDQSHHPADDESTHGRSALQSLNSR